MFKVKLPPGTTLHVETITFPGLLRPKHFVKLTLKSVVLHHPLERYARSWPILLRYRLWKKTRKLVASHRKLAKFVENQDARVD